MSAAVDKINELFLPANYEADKQLQRIIEVIKTREGETSPDCHRRGEKILIL